MSTHMMRLAHLIAMAGLLLCGATRADPLLPPAIRINITEIIAAVAPNEGTGYAAVGFDGTNYWVARWASSRMTRISTAGTFVDSFDIPGLSGTRSMTWDGTHFWMANNTTTLTRVDPSTRTVVGTITVPASVRTASYDPVADGGMGGFWISAFEGDVLLVNRQGIVLNTLPSANIAYTSRYGMALDRSGQAARLWTYFQGGSNTAELGSIALPGGVSDPVTTNLLPFMGAGILGIAGGAFITNRLPGGRVTLLTLCQCDSNILLGIELGDPAIFRNGFEQP